MLTGLQIRSIAKCGIKMYTLRWHVSLTKSIFPGDLHVLEIWKNLQFNMLFGSLKFDMELCIIGTRILLDELEPYLLEDLDYEVVLFIGIQWEITSQEFL